MLGRNIFMLEALLTNNQVHIIIILTEYTANHSEILLFYMLLHRDDKLELNIELQLQSTKIKTLNDITVQKR